MNARPMRALGYPRNPVSGLVALASSRCSANPTS
jgi:hypothetical protein